MSYQIIVESKAWNKADLIDGHVNVLWDSEISFDILKYQIRDGADEVVFCSEDEEDINKWFTERKDSE